MREETVLVLSKLPPFHPATLRLLAISVESESALAEFEEVFRSDPAFAADLLVVANSAELGLRSRIAGIPHALSYLGLERVRSLACSIALRFYFRSVPRTDYMKMVWAHSIATAVIVEVWGIAFDQHDLYTAGLTHDLGRLAISQSIGARYSDGLAQEFGSIQESLAREKEIAGLNHCEAGRLIASQWGFPQKLRNFMLHHHEPVEGKPSEPNNLIRSACQLASALGFPEVQQRDMPEPVIPDGLRKRPGFRPDRLRTEIANRIQAIGG